MNKWVFRRILIGGMVLLTAGTIAAPFAVSSDASRAMLIIAVAVAVFLITQIHFEGPDRDLATLWRAGLSCYASLFWLPIIVKGQTGAELAFSMVLYGAIVITVAGALVMGLIYGRKSTGRGASS